MFEEHLALTGSPRARALLEDWDPGRFVRIAPIPPVVELVEDDEKEEVAAR